MNNTMVCSLFVDVGSSAELSTVANRCRKERVPSLFQIWALKISLEPPSFWLLLPAYSTVSLVKRESEKRTG